MLGFPFAQRWSLADAGLVRYQPILLFFADLMREAPHWKA
jgi:hypothetical protein